MRVKKVKLNKYNNAPAQVEYNKQAIKYYDLYAFAFGAPSMICVRLGDIMASHSSCIGDICRLEFE